MKILLSNILVLNFALCKNVDLDPDPDSRNLLDPDPDPDSMYPDPQHCQKLVR